MGDVLLGAGLLYLGFCAGWLRCAWVHNVSLQRYFKPRDPPRRNVPPVKLVPPA
jgi:hypothetical protein